jgi:hypothetical protein
MQAALKKTFLFSFHFFGFCDIVWNESSENVLFPGWLLRVAGNSAKLFWVISVPLPGRVRFL